MYYYVPYMLIMIVFVDGEKMWVHRNPRYLTFPMGIGNKIQIIAGFGIPVEVEETSVTFGLIVKTNYGLPTNASQFTQPDVAFQPSDSKMTRWYLYRSLVTALERLSLGGKDCLLRSICEAAITLLGHNGLAGQLLHVILTPSSTVNDPWEGQEEYLMAETLGKNSTEVENCTLMFPKCSQSILDMISSLSETTFAKVIHSLEKR